ncbi:MAG: site-2 protease family protein [Nitrospinota bacterium]|nr:site-2 protease family protein [Nitrospinota bacterium]
MKSKTTRRGLESFLSFLMTSYVFGVLSASLVIYWHTGNVPLADWLALAPHYIPALALNIIIFFPLLYLSIVIHEMGHVLAGVASGMEILRVQIGIGRKLFKFRLFGIEFAFLTGWGGLTFTGDVPQAFVKTRFFIMIAGGVTAQIGAVGCAVALMGTAWLNGMENLGLFPVHIFVGINVFLVAFNLIPFTYLGAGTPLSTDGRLLAQIPFLSDEQTEDYMASAYINRSHALIMSSDFVGAEKILLEGVAAHPSSKILKINLASSLIPQGRCQEAEPVLANAMENEPPPLTAAMLRLNLAAVWLFDGSFEGIEKAMEYSEKAYADLAKMHGAAVIRGAALMEAGKTDEAMAILAEQVHLAKPLHMLTNDSVGHIYLAYGYHLKGEVEKGRELIEKVEASLEPLSPYDQALLERVIQRTQDFWRGVDYAP